jgi:hypothetical protein
MNVQKTKWIERGFNFDFPMGMFPVIFERLKGTPARIEEIIKNISEKNLEVQLNNGWSIKEHIGHLTDLEELHTGRVEDFNSGLKTLRPADMTNKKTYDANHNNISSEKLILNFRNTRKHFCNTLKNKNEEELGVSAIHPRLNKLIRLVDMAYFVAEHDDQHLAGMREIIDSLK